MKDLCNVCNKNEKEVYQLDLEVCYDCWMNENFPDVSDCIRYYVEIKNYGWMQRNISSKSYCATCTILSFRNLKAYNKIQSLECCNRIIDSKFVLYF